jgi:hypothetical protein
MTILEEAEILVKENDATTGIASVDHIASKYEEYLNMTEDMLFELSKQDCIHIQYILTQYAISVNKKYNKLQSIYEINNTIFNRELAKVWSSYDNLGFMSNDLRVAHATNEYKYLEEMQNELLKLKTVILSMDGLMPRIDSMIKILNNLTYTKGR